MKYQNVPEGLRLPVKLDTTTNGEFAPVPLEPIHRHARRLALEEATTRSRRLGLDRRSFLVSACGAASTLASFNAAYAAAGRTGGFFQLPPESPLDQVAARSAVDGKDFVFDVQGHFVNPTGAWLKTLPAGAKPLQFATGRSSCEPHRGTGNLDYLNCVGP